MITVRHLQDYQAAKWSDKYLTQDGYCQGLKERKIEKQEIECFTVLKVSSILEEKIADKRIQDQEL